MIHDFPFGTALQLLGEIVDFIGELASAPLPTSTSLREAEKPKPVLRSIGKASGKQKPSPSSAKALDREFWELQ